MAVVGAEALGDGEELPRRDVVQLLDDAGRLLDARRVDGRRIAEAELGVEALLVFLAVAAGDLTQLPTVRTAIEGVDPR